jgi:hypothetical protein
MPRNSIADVTTDLQNLDGTVRASAADVPGVGVHMTSLGEVLGGLQDLNASVETRKGLKQEESQKRRALLKQGKDLAIQIRAALKAHFGPRSERLVEFGIRPLRPRKGSSTNNEPGPAQPPTPAPEVTSKTA